MYRMKMQLTDARNRWIQLLGESHVLSAEAAQICYGSDTGGAERRLAGALRVMDAGVVPDVVRVAHDCGVPLYPISTGRNWGYGSALPVRDDCMIVDLSGMRRIVHFDAEMGVVTLEPGVTQGMLADFLTQRGHPFLVPVTGAGPSCSLLGNALERGYGVTPHADHFSAVTDIEAVLADGTVYRTTLREVAGEELARLFKWGIGPYATGLFTQSGFGIVTRMSIVLAPRPESVKVCLFSLRDDSLLEPAVARIRSILGNLPGTVGAINLMNRHRVLSMSAPFPRDRLGTDGLIPEAVIEEMGKQYQVQAWTGFTTLYGTKRVVAAAQKDIRQALAGVASRVLFLNSASARTLARIAGAIPGTPGRRLASTAGTLTKSLELVNGHPNETALPLAYWRHPELHEPGRSRHPAQDGCGLLWYAPLVPMRPADARAYVEMVRRTTKQHGIEPLITFTTLNDRLFDSTVPLLFDRTDPRASASGLACYHALVQAGHSQGWFPYRIGIDALEKLLPVSTDPSSLPARLKKGLDPEGILSPGRYL
jgi:FAD/FMN-containing dehydrogenase